jgi:hypothetical protein
MCGTSFMAHKHVANLWVLEKRVINRQHGAAGIAENGVDTLREQGFNQYLCAGFFGHFSCPSNKRSPPIAASQQGGQVRAVTNYKMACQQLKMK